MTWFGYLMIALLLLNVFVCISIIGKPRQPMTTSAANFATLFNGLLILGILAVGTGSL